MGVLFLGCLFKKMDEKELLSKSKIGISNASNTYQWNLIEGLNAIMENPLTIINVLPVGTFPKYYRSFCLTSKAWAHTGSASDYEVGSINLPLFKQLIRTLKLKKIVRSWISKQKDARSNIIIYSTYLPFLIAVSGLPSKIRKILIVTDLPEYSDLSSSTNIIRKIARRIYNQLIYRSLRKIDYFVILTDKMRIPLNVGDRPYVVVEGIASNNNLKKLSSIEEPNNPKILLYTGGLHKQFGINTLIDAVKLLDKQKYQLWFCGKGEMQGVIEEASITHDNIKYLGYREKSEINKLQEQATVLINPRTNYGEYTNYSFPSKTMEYMLSGRPVIMYKLNGIPDEYDKYLYYINGNKPKDVANKIIEVCGKPQSELNDFAEKARRFVSENKSCIVQAKKIMELIEIN